MTRTSAPFFLQSLPLLVGPGAPTGRLYAVRAVLPSPHPPLLTAPPYAPTPTPPATPFVVPINSSPSRSGLPMLNATCATFAPSTSVTPAFTLAELMDLSLHGFRPSATQLPHNLTLRLSPELGAPLPAGAVTCGAWPIFTVMDSYLETASCVPPKPVAGVLLTLRLYWSGPNPELDLLSTVIRPPVTRASAPLLPLPLP